MFSVLTKRFAVVAVLLSMFALAACGDKEPEQRKAFIEYLQTRILTLKTLTVPFPNQKQKEAFGPYADHYAVIENFSRDMDISAETMKKFASLQQKVRSMQGIQQNWKDVAELRDVFRDKVMPEVDKRLRAAEEARAALKQPDDLKAVYDQAFAKTVVEPAKAAQVAYPAIVTTMDKVEALGKFLDDNKDKLRIMGMTVQPLDEKLQKPLQDLLDSYNKAGAELITASRALLELAGKRVP